jgi:hypothetical protein
MPHLRVRGALSLRSYLPADGEVLPHLMNAGSADRVEFMGS